MRELALTEIEHVSGGTTNVWGDPPEDPTNPPTPDGPDLPPIEDQPDTITGGDELPDWLDDSFGSYEPPEPEAEDVGFCDIVPVDPLTGDLNCPFVGS